MASDKVSIPTQPIPRASTGGDGRVALAIWRTREFQIIAVVGILFGCAVLAQTPGLNGLWYWVWPWQSLGLLRTAGYLAPALVPFAAACYFMERDRLHGKVWPILALIMLASFALQLGVLLAHGRGLSLLAAIVRSDLTTSYFTDALAIKDLPAWLANFPNPSLHLHSLTHPPGPILYYFAWLQFAEPGTAALWGGLAIGILATLAIPLLYAFAGLWTIDRRARLGVCAFYALMPGIAVFLPEFDQVYPILSMAMALAWINALRDRRGAMPLFALALSAALFFAYNLLATGLFLILYALYFLWQQGWKKPAWSKLVQVCGGALALIVAVYFLLWLATGYNPALNFWRAVDMQQRLEQGLMPRPRLPSLLFDPYNFVLGSGILVVPLWLSAARDWRVLDWAREPVALSLMALATILLVDASGMLRGETTRVWLFLQPLCIVPAALQLQRFGVRHRTAVFGLQWCITVVLVCKMAFLDP